MANYENIENFDLIVEGIRQGKYSLFLGAGVSRDSSDSTGKLLPDGEAFRKQICSINNLPSETSLSQAAELLTDEDKFTYITKIFSNTIPGKTYENFCKFIWKNIYTLNVDDCIEKSYESCPNLKQNIVVKNYKDIYEQSYGLDCIQVVHLHGFARQPEKGYVFDLNEYVNNIRESNSWYKVFANSFAVSPFIVSGVSFNEPDFKYYVNQRNSIDRDGFCPSILIEPSPTKITENLCKKHGLQLIEMTFGDFLSLVNAKLPNPSSVFELSTEKNNILIDAKNLAKENIVSFYKDFSEIKKVETSEGYENSLKFELGEEPTLEDIENHLDIHREVTTCIYKRIKKELQSYDKSFLLVAGDFYSGKTTSVLSALYQLAIEKNPVFWLKCVNGFNVANSAECLNALGRKVIVFIDNLSDYIEQAELLFKKASNLIIVGAERNYRKTHVDNVLSVNYEEIDSNTLTVSEITSLFDKYREKGINTQKDAVKNPENFIRRYPKQTIGEYACLLINDFKPIEECIPQLFNELSDLDREVFATVCLAYHSYRTGVHYEVLKSIFPRSYDLWGYFKKDYPLKLAFNWHDEDKNYIIPKNKILADCTFKYLLKNNIDILQKSYKNLLNALSCYVTRQTLKQRSAEAKLAGRLFDIDNTLVKLFQDDTVKVLEELKEKWSWNSRYWEQMALAVYNKDVKRAVLHAKQAVAIERHPNTLTTLSKIQFKMMEVSSAEDFIVNFEEACSTVLQAFDLEFNRSYSTIHPFIVLKNGLDSFLHEKRVDEINVSMRENIRTVLLSYVAKRHFPISEREHIEKMIEALS